LDEVPKLDNGKLKQSCHTVDLGHGNLKKKCTGTHEGAVSFPASLHFLCDKGYTVDGSVADAKRHIAANCKADGTFYGMQFCQPITCGTARILGQTELVSPGQTSAIMFGQEAAYKCKEGHTVGGEADGKTEFKTKCQSNGILTDPLVCDPVVCGKAPSATHGRANIADSVSYGEHLQYLCDSGHTLDGTRTGKTKFTRDCLKTGKFSDLKEGETCEAISAGAIPVIQFAELKEYNGEAVGGRKATQRPEGHIRQDGDTFTKWAGAAAAYDSAISWKGKAICVKNLQTGTHVRVGITTNPADSRNFVNGKYVGLFPNGRIFVPRGNDDSYTTDTQNNGADGDLVCVKVAGTDYVVFKNGKEIHSWSGANPQSTNYVLMHFYELGSGVLVEKASGSTRVCANNEGDTCKCHGAVYYGKKYVDGQPGHGREATIDELQKSAHNRVDVAGEVQCANGALGDPIGGFYKRCWCETVYLPAAPQEAHYHPNGGLKWECIPGYTLD
jgi:hypothetical protein